MDGLRGVIPNSCKHNEVVIEQNLFEEVERTVLCPGCQNETFKGHNGAHCFIREWGCKDHKTGKNNRKIRFIDLVIEQRCITLSMLRRYTSNQQAPYGESQVSLTPDSTQGQSPVTKHDLSHERKCRPVSIKLVRFLPQACKISRSEVVRFPIKLVRLAHELVRE